MLVELPTSLDALVTVTPENALQQGDALALADQVFASKSAHFERMRPVFTNAGIQKRQIAMPVEWYLEDRGWDERTEAYIRVATDLFCRATRDALERAELAPDDIDAVVTVSSTGIATPSLDARASQVLGFRPDILRVPVFGLGCAGGVGGMAIASRLSQSMPGGNVLLVVVELCSLAFRFDRATKANIVATALFGDGAAAAVFSARTERSAVTISSGSQHTWPKTLDIMGWNVDPTGFEVIFDRAIPPFAREHLRPAVENIMQRAEISLSDVSRMSFHPGGTKVLEAIEQAFEMQSGSLDIERRVLSSYGNMSAPTVLFILEEAIRKRTAGLSMITALGPGFTAASLPIRVLQ